MGGEAMGRVTVMFLAVLMLSGCKHTERMTVEKTTVDTLYKYRVRVDSVVRSDSITLTVMGDTVLRDRWHTLHVYHTEVDTVYRIKVVKEPQPFEVMKTVEVNRLHWWQKLLCYAGGMALLILSCLVLVWLVKRKIKSWQYP